MRGQTFDSSIFKAQQTQALEQAQAEVWDIDDELLARMEAREDVERVNNDFNDETFEESLDEWIWPDRALTETIYDQEFVHGCVCSKLLFQRRRTKRSHVNFLPSFDGDIPAFRGVTDNKLATYVRKEGEVRELSQKQGKSKLSWTTARPRGLVQEVLPKYLERVGKQEKWKSGFSLSRR